MLLEPITGTYDLVKDVTSVRKWQRSGGKLRSLGDGERTPGEKVQR